MRPPPHIERAAEPAGLRTKTPQQALRTLVELVGRIEGLEVLLTDPSPDDGSWDEVPIAAFYGVGARPLGLFSSPREAVLTYDTRSGKSSDFLLVDWFCGRLIEAFQEEDSARESNDDERTARARQTQRHVAYHLAAVLRFDQGIASLLRQATDGDDKSLFKLLEINKSAVTLPVVQERLIRAQRLGDWEFFECIGKAIAAPPLGADPATFRVQLVTAAMWDWYLKDLSYPQIMKLFVKHRLLPRNTNEESFRKTLNRLGFKKFERSKTK